MTSLTSTAPHLAEFEVYGLGSVRTLASFEAAVGVSFGGGVGGASGAAASKPKLVRADARWGGQPSELFNETAPVDVGSLLRAFAAS